MATEELDVVIVGGGITGAGAALDAVSRGLSVGLIEARDWASGTSSRSSKLIHGGLRYLEQLHFGLVAEALRERALLVERLAPHLVRPVPFLFPLRRRYVDRAYVGSGLFFYDLMAGTSRAGRSQAISRHRHLSRQQTLAIAPAIRQQGLRGGFRYFDAQVDDARYTVEVVRTAAAYGARVANRAKVVGFLRQGNRVRGVVVHDEETGVEFEARARQVICAGGVWTSGLQSLACVTGGLDVRMSKGVHLVLPKECLPLETGLIVRAGKSVLLVIPSDRHWLVGTTDTDWSLSPDDPSVNRGDIAYLLQHLNSELSLNISQHDVVAAYAGLRPLLQGKAASTARLSREHAVAQPRPGLTVVAGGKFTTYRVMAADAVDAALANLGDRLPRSRTAQLPLIGARGYTDVLAERDELARRGGVSPEVAQHLLSRYGSLIGDVLAAAAEDPALAETVPGADEYLLAEVRYAASDEGALHIEDVLERRTRIAIEYPDAGVAAAESVGAVMGAVHGWSSSRLEDEVARYRRRAAAALAAQSKPDDAAADAEIRAAASR